MSKMQNGSKEAARKKTLGELGELLAIKALVDKEFDNIRNLNDDHMNKAFADIYCEKNGKRYVISVKARNKYRQRKNPEDELKVNTRYNLGKNAYENAEKVAKEYDAIPCYMAIQIGEHDYSVFFGELSELNNANAIPITKCEKGELGQVLVARKKHYLNIEPLSNQL